MDKIKVVLLGEYSVGKTSINTRLISGRYGCAGSTVGASYTTYIEDDLKFNIWDTAGSERFMALMPLYYRNAEIVILVYDLADLFTIERIKHLIEQLMNDLHNEFVVIIVGNKLDTIPNDKVILEAIDQINKINLLPIYEHIQISAKTGANMDLLKDAIVKCGRVLYNNRPRNISIKDVIVEKPKKKEGCEC